MKLELKTENENYSNSFSNILGIFFKFALLITFCNISLKLGIISRHYQIEYNCKLLSVDKSIPNFKKLSRLSDIKSKQRIWEFCNKYVK